MNMITARGIKRCFTVGNGEPFYALKGIDLDIPEGKLAILKGRSGSGKTTLLNILSALDEATEGQVIIEDHDLSEMAVPEREKLRRYDIGFVFQSVALIPIMNAYENVDFGLRLAEMKETGIPVSARFWRWLDLVPECSICRTRCPVVSSRG